MKKMAPAFFVFLSKIYWLASHRQKRPFHGQKPQVALLYFACSQHGWIAEAPLREKWDTFGPQLQISVLILASGCFVVEKFKKRHNFITHT